MRPQKPKKREPNRLKLKPVLHLDQFEKELSGKGYLFIAGVDEVGRGPLAGPVVAAAVIFLDKDIPEGINDSKQLSDAERRRLYDLLMQNERVLKGIGICDEKIIDQINIREASFHAMLAALEKLPVKPDYVLVDGFKIPSLQILQMGIVKGDSLSYSIAAASILAKVTRDNLMLSYHETYPEYGFGRHKGYGTAEHLEALQRLGPSPIHRMSFEPVGQLKLIL
jgi:ribonuclease HII